MSGVYEVATSEAEGMVGVMERQPPMSISDKELAWLLFHTHGAVLHAWEHAHVGRFPAVDRGDLADLLDEVSVQLRKVAAPVIEHHQQSDAGKHHLHGETSSPLTPPERSGWISGACDSSPDIE